jgi:hypothetical protein
MVLGGGRASDSPRPLSHPPAELSIADAMEDALDFLVDVRRLDPGEYFLL